MSEVIIQLLFPIALYWFLLSFCLSRSGQNQQQHRIVTTVFSNLLEGSGDLRTRVQDFDKLVKSSYWPFL